MRDALPVTDLLAPPSFLRGVLALDGWSRLQHVWDGVPAIAAGLCESRHAYDWDTLRLSTHRLITTFPFDTSLLPPGGKTLLINLMHRRLDSCLDMVTRARLQRQAYDTGAVPPSPHGAFSPMQVLKSIEAHVLGLQQSRSLPAITKAIFGRINGDDNLELLSRMHGEISASARDTLWPTLLEWVLALSFHNDPVDLCLMDVESLMGSHDAIQLIHDTIKGDPPLKVAEAAVRLAERFPDTAIVPSLASLLAGRYPNHLKRSIAMVLTAVGDSTAIAHLVRITLSDTPDLIQDGQPFW
ncbi:MAG: HEAT repeat domain-containing protein, partial [Candidatus Sericytochromatia bacterium]|nr:HEAT repeat domain-containing protein [Candidatus Sericytochromatia bacterium]